MPFLQTLNPTANQTPDAGQPGTLAVDGITNNGHGSTVAAANASANGGEFIGADAQADASITISNIRLEALMQDSRVIAA